MTEDKFSTKHEISWCPGCFNFKILEAVKKALSKLISEGIKQEDFVMTAGIGCHAKIFDYLNISGVYSLHGRVIPAALGIRLGNPNLVVLGFAGDGDTYAEGMTHFIHAGRFNADMTLIVHDNQTFALTTGQSTPTTQQKYISKACPLGELKFPLNPMKIALASGISFIARAHPQDVEHTSKIIEKAIKHKGFSFVEMLQPCLQFNKEMNDIGKLVYKIGDNKDDMKKAWALADEWDYNSKDKKIPVGIFYQESRPTLEERWPILKELKNKGTGWKNRV